MNGKTEEEIEIYFKENKKLFIGILIGALLVGSIFYFHNHQKEEILTSQNDTNEQLEGPSWYERNQETINKYTEIIQEADALKNQGKYAEAIVKYKEALDLVSYRTLFVDNKEDFYETHKNLSKEEKLDKVSEFIFFGNSAATAYYSLSFAYRGAKDVENNMQYAIDSVKQAVKEIDKIILLEEIEDELDPDRFKLFEENLSQKRKAAYLSMLGDLYRLYGAYDLSIKTHKQAIKLDPENSDHYVWYGLALFLNGQKSLARQQWEKALEFDPDNADASRFLERYSF